MEGSQDAPMAAAAAAAHACGDPIDAPRSGPLGRHRPAAAVRRSRRAAFSVGSGAAPNPLSRLMTVETTSKAS
jgi:hypothetical protein